MTQNNAMGSTKDLGKIVYVRALWMNKWLGGVPGIVEESDVQSSKVYRHHSASGGRTLKTELNAGRTAFERYVADVKSGGKDRNEAEFVGAVAEFMEVLPLHCNNNWSSYKSYVLKWMEKHSTTGLATPYDAPLLDQLLKDMVTSQTADEDPSAEAVNKSTEALAEATRVLAAQQTEHSRAVSIQMGKLADAQRAGAAQQAAWQMMPPQGEGMMPPYAYPPHMMAGQHPPQMMQCQGPPMVPPQQYGQQWYQQQGPGMGGQGWQQQQQGQVPDGRFGGPRPPPQSPGVQGFTGCNYCRQLDHIASKCPSKQVKEDTSCAPPRTPGRCISRGEFGEERACATSKTMPRSQVSETGGAGLLPSVPTQTRPIMATARDATKDTRFRAALGRVCEGAAGAECSWPPVLTGKTWPPLRCLRHRSETPVPRWRGTKCTSTSSGDLQARQVPPRCVAVVH